MKCKPWIRHFSPPKFQCFSSQFALHGLRALDSRHPKLVGISLQFHFLERKTASRRFSAYGGAPKIPGNRKEKRLKKQGNPLGGEKNTLRTLSY